MSNGSIDLVRKWDSHKEIVKINIKLSSKKEIILELEGLGRHHLKEPQRTGFLSTYSILAWGRG
jgi:hypothetical protein